MTMSFFSFGQSADVDVVLSDAETKKKVEHKTEDGKKDKYFLFYDGETVSGKVNVTLKNPGKRLEHQGIKVEFVGQIGRMKLKDAFTNDSTVSPVQSSSCQLVDLSINRDTIGSYSISDSSIKKHCIYLFLAAAHHYFHNRFFIE